MIYGHKADRAYRRLNTPSSGGSFRGHLGPIPDPEHTSPRFYFLFFYFFTSLSTLSHSLFS